MYHIPVLLHESINGLRINPAGTYVDVTFGGGGHSREILRHLSPEGRLYSFDQDADAERNVPEGDERFTFVRSNFRYLTNWMRYYGVDGVDGLIADLGVSSHHFDAEERGFSFRYDAPLDMRMNGRAGMTAADLVNTYDEERLANVLYLYGELKNSRRLASAIVKARGQKNIVSIDDLLQAVKPLMPREREKKRPGTSVSGTAHRGEPGNGCLAGNAGGHAEGSAPGRTPGGTDLSLVGGPHGEELCTRRTGGRKGGKGLLRTVIHPVESNKQPGDCAERGGATRKPAQPLGQTENCRKNFTMTGSRNRRSVNY